MREGEGFNPEDKTNLEGIEAENIASQKLEKLTDPEFREFGIRFMNEAEYEEMVTGKRFIPHEIYVMSNSWSKSSFSEYLTESGDKGFWGRVMRHQTKWDFSVYDVSNANTFIKLLKDAYQESHEGSEHSISDIRAKTLGTFREILTERLLKEYDEGDNLWWSCLVSGAKRVESQDDTESVRAVRDFLNDPDWLNQPANLRRLYHAVAYEDQKLYHFPQEDMRQYHVAAVFDFEAIDFGSRLGFPETHVWQYLKYVDQSGQSLLGAISAMPDKEMWEKMTDLSSGSGEWAHPIFSNTGRVVFPKTKTSENDAGNLDKEGDLESSPNQ